MARGRLHAWRCLAVLALLPVLALAAWWGVGGLVNVTPSLPYGFYMKSGQSVERGSLAVFCLPGDALTLQARERGHLRAGHCPGGWMPLIKRVAAVAGDHVRFSDQAVFVNGHALANSGRIQRDLQGRSMPRPQRLDVVLAGEERLLMSDYNANSFDARYFGVIDGDAAVVVPVLTWDASLQRRQPSTLAVTK